MLFRSDVHQALPFIHKCSKSRFHSPLLTSLAYTIRPFSSSAPRGQPLPENKEDEDPDFGSQLLLLAECVKQGQKASQETIGPSHRNLKSPAMTTATTTPVIQLILCFLIALQPKLTQDRDDPDKMRGYYRIFVEAGEWYTPLILRHPETFLPTVPAIRSCCDYEDLEVFGITQLLVSTLQGTTSQERRCQRKTIARHLLQSGTNYHPPSPLSRRSQLSSRPGSR